ncbi:carbon-nitrogen hydrolase family protein [Actinoplanes subtropicus]|uniref:carbon-nitrogen hydrolase family protein n=1 Tax=Actinoplanes subtropicus TaxID=543632 RepID=UPI000A7398DB|nr:carbon-nitrogen hydrolase family protein [Actinoplanes subtropicus]
MELTVAGLQAAGVPGDVEANRAQLRVAAAEAAATGAGLLITPELYLTGYDIGDQVRELARLDLAGTVRQIAREAGIAILAGLPEPAGERLHNTAILVDERGEVLLRYRKTHLFGDLDRRYFVPGDDLVVMAELHGVRIAVLICYDVEFPETVRAAAERGADLIAVPTAQMTPFAFVAEQVIRARAWENQVFVAYINHAGRERTLEYVGRSSIVAPSGDVLASAADGDHLLLATVDTDVVARARAANPYLADRRTDLYRRVRP